MDERTCSVAGCDKGGVLHRGWCAMHYYRWRIHGSFDLPERPAITCSIDGCEGDGKLTRDMCGMHYARWLRYGDPLFVKYIKGDVMARFWSHVDQRGPDECWPWTSHVDDDGYGHFTVDSKSEYATRWLCEQTTGQMLSGWETDHLCHSRDSSCRGGKTCLHRRCCNPAHLEAVPKKVNVLRGLGPTAVNARKEVCDNGHEFTPENTIRRPTGNRGCRECHREGDRKAS